MQFRWNLQLLTGYSLSRNPPCSTTDLLVVETDMIYAALNTSGVSRTIVLDISNVFWQDRACYCSSSQFKFYIFYGKMFFLIDSFLSSRKLWVAWKYKWNCKCTSNCRLHQNSILIYLFSSTLIVSLIIFCEMLLSE